MLQKLFRSCVVAAVAAMGFAAFGGNVPAIYMPVAYLASTNKFTAASQNEKMIWIDTGYRFKAGQTFRIEWAQEELTGLSDEDKGWGCGGGMSPSGDNNYNITGAGRRRESAVCAYIFNGHRFFVDAGNNRLPTSQLAVGDWYVDTVGITNTTLSYEMVHLADGKRYAVSPLTTPTNPFDSRNNIFLFKDNSSAFPLPGKKRIRAAKLWDNATGEVFFDLVPVRRLEDSKPGFYDRVSGGFLVNQGKTSDFVLGADDEDFWNALEIAGDPGSYNTPSPDWGRHIGLLDKQKIVCTAPAAGGSVDRVPGGYVLYTRTPDDADWVETETGTGTTCEYVHQQGRMAKLVWIWNVPTVGGSAVTDVTLDGFTVSTTVGSLGNTAAMATVKVAWGRSKDRLVYTNDVTTATAAGLASGTVTGALTPSATHYAQVFVVSADGMSADPAGVVEFAAPAAGELIVPPEYEHIEYLESHGDEWIDTGVNSSDRISAEIDIQFVQIGYSGSCCFFGERVVTGPNFAFWANSSGLNAGVNFGYDPGVFCTKTTFDKRHKLRNQGPSLYVDDVLEYDCKVSYNPFDNNYTLYVFSMRVNTGGVADDRNFSGRVYGLKMWDGATLVRDFVAVRRRSDGEYGLYDRATTKKFYPNISGKGAFTGGGTVYPPNSLLTVTAEPTEEGVADPAYGLYENLAAGTSFECFAPVAAAGGHLTCLGATVYTNAADDATAWLAWQELQVADGRVTYTHPENSNAKLEWHLAAANPLGLGAVTLKSAGVNSLDVSVNVTGIGVEADSAELTLAYGVASDALDGHKSATVTGMGPAVVTLQPLVPGTVYYVKASLSNAEGEVASDVVQFAVPAFHECEAGRQLAYYSLTGKHGAWNTAHYAYAHTSVEADFTAPHYGSQCRPFSAGASGLSFEIYENVNCHWAYNSFWGTAPGPNTNVGDGGEGTTIGSSGKPVRWDITLDLYGTKNLTIVNRTKGETLYDKSLGSTPPAEAKSKWPIFLGALPLSETTFKNDPVADVQYHEVKIFEYGELAGDIIPYRRASDGAVGLYDRFTRKFLAWVAENGATAATAPSPDAEPLGKAVVKCLLQRDGVKLTCGGDASDATLYRVSGNVYGAEDPAAWAAADDLGTLEASVSETTAALPDGWGEDATLMRFFVVTAGENETAVTNWSETVFWQDTDVPMFAGDLALDGVGGDTLVVEGELDNLGGDSCTLTVYTGPSAEDLSVAWTGLADSTRTATGPFALTLAGAALVPGETVYAVVEARAGKKVARSKVASVTLAADGVLTPGTLRVEHKTIIAPFTIAQLGAKGQLNQVQLWVGPAADQLELAETFDVPATAWEHPEVKVTDALSHLFADFGDVYWQLRYVVTTAAGTQTMTDQSEAKKQDLVDMAVYTWKQSVAAGDWANAANWETDRPGDCLGYPQTARATARFDMGTTATVTLASDIVCGSLDLTESNLVVTITGTAATRLTADVMLGASGNDLVKNSEVVIDGAAISTRTELYVDSGVKVELRNGADLKILSNRSLRLTPKRTTPYGNPFLRVGEGCTLSAYEVTIGSDAVLELAGEATVGVVYFNHGSGSSKAVEGGWVRLVGENPRLVVNGSDLRSIDDYSGASRGGFEFVIPKKGYLETPVVGAFANFAVNENSQGIVVRVLDESPAFTRSVDQVIELMSVNSVNTNKVAFQALKRETRGSTFLYATDAADPVWTLPSETTATPKAIGVKTIGAKGVVISIR